MSPAHVFSRDLAIDFLSIRRFRKEDADPLLQLKLETIRTINAKDYSDNQLKAWAPDDIDPLFWRNRICAMNPYVAERGTDIVGFADIQLDGYIDHFFCNKDAIGQGVGRALMQKLIHEAKKRGIPRLYSNVSITAQPFFLHFGFSVVTEQLVEVRGVQLTNYHMERWVCS